MNIFSGGVGPFVRLHHPAVEIPADPPLLPLHRPHMEAVRNIDRFRMQEMPFLREMDIQVNFAFRVRDVASLLLEMSISSAPSLFVFLLPSIVYSCFDGST